MVLIGPDMHFARADEELLSDSLERPTVGDWLAVLPSPQPLAVARLSRKSFLVRGSASRGSTLDRLQPLGANIDVVFIVTSANKNFNVRRLERYVTVVRAGGAQPVVVVNKADLVADVEPLLASARAVAPGVEAVATSTFGAPGMAAVEGYLSAGKTFALLGSSGVGKSSIAAVLTGAQCATGAIRSSDDTGKHTTTGRCLLPLPCGGVLMDTPGMRSLGLAGGEEEAKALSEGFADMSELASFCRYRGCAHCERSEGCALRAAVSNGEVEEGRLLGYIKLQQELLKVCTVKERGRGRKSKA